MFHNLVCVASVYRRGSWNSGLGLGFDARAEKTFSVSLTPAFEEAEVAQMLAKLVPWVEKWLVKVKADLVNDVVVTVYAVEPSDAPTLDGSAA